MNDSGISAGKAVGRIIIAFLLALAVFFLCNVAAGITAFLTKNQQTAQPAVHIAMLVFSFVLILVFSKGKLKSYGFCWPRSTGQVLWPVLLGLIAGAASTVLLLLIPSEGSGSIIPEGYSMLKVILLVWLLASVAEEFAYRGLVQGFLSALKDKKVLRVISLPVLISALLFSASHLILLTRGVDIFKLLVILAFTFSLGLIAGYWQEKSESIIPAIVAHICANIGGFAVGVIIAVIQTI